MQSINITEDTGGWAVEFNLWVADLNVLGYEHSMRQPDCCLGSELTDVPSQSWRGGMNEWKSCTPFMAAKQLIFKCNRESHASTARCSSSKCFSCTWSTFLFFYACHCSKTFLLLCKSLEPSRLDARDIILLFAGRSVTSVFCSPRKSESSIDVKGSAHRGREISTLEAGSASWMRILL